MLTSGWWVWEDLVSVYLYGWIFVEMSSTWLIFTFYGCLCKFRNRNLISLDAGLDLSPCCSSSEKRSLRYPTNDNRLSNRQPSPFYYGVTAWKPLRLFWSGIWEQRIFTPPKRRTSGTERPGWRSVVHTYDRKVDPSSRTFTPIYVPRLVIFLSAILSFSHPSNLFLYHALFDDREYSKPSYRSQDAPSGAWFGRSQESDRSRRRWACHESRLSDGWVILTEIAVNIDVIVKTDGYAVPSISVDTAQQYENERGKTKNPFSNKVLFVWFNNIVSPEVGTGIKKSGVPRSQIFICTKWQPRPDGVVERPTPEQVCQEAHQSVLRLDQSGSGKEYLDLMLIHHPRPDPDGRAVHWKGLALAQKEGWVKDIGVSNLWLHVLYFFCLFLTLDTLAT